MTNLNQPDSQDDSTSIESPAVWLVRAGRYGEDEAAALENSVAIIGWSELSDLSDAGTREVIVGRLEQVKPDKTKGYIANISSQLYAFSHLIRQGDIVALPLKTQPGLVALGRVIAPYRYQEVENDSRHTVPLRWVRPAVPRVEFGQDLLYSMGSAKTVSRIQRNNAASRIAKIIEGHSDLGEPIAEDTLAGEDTDDEGAFDERATLDYIELTRQQILDHIRVRFPGHDLTRLVSVILQAEGFTTTVSPPGPDGGVDILASKGSLGLETPRLCVQVKATGNPIDVSVYRALVGTMQSFGAEQGLLVSWSGFTNPTTKESKKDYFSVRLWTAEDMLDAIYRTYDRLPSEIRREIPLQQIWVLTLNETGSG